MRYLAATIAVLLFLVILFVAGRLVPQVVQMILASNGL